MDACYDECIEYELKNMDYQLVYGSNIGLS